MLDHVDLNYQVEGAQSRPRGRPTRRSKPKEAPSKQSSTPFSMDLPQRTISGPQINRPHRYIVFITEGGGVSGVAGCGTVVNLISLKLSFIYLTSFSVQVYGHHILG